MEHVRLLVQQQRGETIKAGWDPARGTRRRRPAATADRQAAAQRSLSVSDGRRDQRAHREVRDAAAAARAKSATKLAALESQSIPTAKSEYLATAEDARSEDLQRIIGKAALIELRDKAKLSYQALCKTRDTLRSEIAHGTRQWDAMTPSYAPVS
ncbi:hypothetical protein PINS_up023128 [Pythium insidiosum]|nr:hypothetical protein PINS_up023128 [Pythium insidiosum]